VKTILYGKCIECGELPQYPICPWMPDSPRLSTKGRCRSCISKQAVDALMVAGRHGLFPGVQPEPEHELKRLDGARAWARRARRDSRTGRFLVERV
jgi:hypothetical protein